MARENAIEVEGVVVEVLPNRTCHVDLPNGHRVRGFLTGQARRNFGQLAAGNSVVLEMSPYDLSVGRIILRKEHGCPRASE